MIEKKPISLYRYNKFDSVSDLMDRYNTIDGIKRRNMAIPVEAYGDQYEIREIDNAFYLYSKKRFNNVYDLALELVNESYDIEKYISHKKDITRKKSFNKKLRSEAKMFQEKGACMVR